MTLNRRAFLMAIGAVGVAHAAPALEVEDDAIRAILRRRVEVEKRSVGMAVCMVMPNGKHFVTWGRERLTDDRPVTSGTVFEIGSVTKVLTAQLLGEMAHRGEVRLDDPVARHLPGDFHVPEFDGRKITLADLATHTSGLPRFPPFPGIPLSPSWLEALTRFSAEDFKAWLANLHIERAPGAVWEYSNAVGYTLLGLALAYRGGRPYEALLQARVIEPAGLQDTTFHPAAAAKSRLAEGHDAALKPVQPFELGIFGPAGGLRSTPRDMARFAAAILPGSGSLISPAAKLLLTVRRPAPPIGGMQALGWEVHDAPGGAFMSKDGVTAGQAASMVFDPDRSMAIIAFSNTLPDLLASTPSGGGIGSADIARHLLRPQIPMEGQSGTTY
jgi:serine-type D-Ala-D-Ala carboxypeptidase/endopeptidase